MASNTTIRIGTRGSQLALWQAREAEDRLKAAGLKTELVIINTKGDKLLDRSLSKIGSKGVFTEELEEGLHQGEIEIAVHSAKDLPSALPKDLEIIAFMEREQVHDVVLSLNKDFTFEQPGIVVGTSSTRRKATLKRLYPSLQLTEARGNLQTRMEKLHNGNFDAMLLAYAGVHRMKLTGHIVMHLPVTEFVPAVGQGSVAIEASTKLDAEVKALIANALNHAPTAECIIAERAFLRTMEGGCSIPVFGLANQAENGISLTGGIISLDGKNLIRETVSGPAANGAKMGAELGKRVLSLGGAEILKEIRQGK